MKTQDITATIYAYCAPSRSSVGADECPPYDPDLHGKPIYVGQTTQPVRRRDEQHLAASDTRFDKQYTRRAQYELVVLERRTFEAAPTNAEFIDGTLRPAAEWMDARERHFIAEFGTHKAGLNSTSGGQGRGWLVAMREGAARAAVERWRTYMPMFRTYHKTHGDINTPQGHEVLGRLVNNIRKGTTSVPPQFEEELFKLGLDLRNQGIVRRDELWSDTYMPTFRTYHKTHGDINTPQGHEVLGRLVNNIRKGTTSVPPQFEEELFGSLGLDLRNQGIVRRDELWSDTYMPMFRAFHTENGHANAPQDHEVLGRLVNNIRKGTTSVPPQFAKELNGVALFRCTQSLARHVSRLLGREVESLEGDADALAAVSDAAAHHARLLGVRKGLTGRDALRRSGLFIMPFGLRPLGDGTARFAEDAAKSRR